MISCIVFAFMSGRLLASFHIKMMASAIFCLCLRFHFVFSRRRWILQQRLFEECLHSPTKVYDHGLHESILTAHKSLHSPTRVTAHDGLYIQRTRAYCKLLIVLSPPSSYQLQQLTHSCETVMWAVLP
jgi:hypothetical protein